MPINVKLLPVKIWWTKVNHNRQSAQSSVTRWGSDIEKAFYDKFKETKKKLDDLDAEIANPKLKAKLWDAPKFEERALKLRSLPAELRGKAYKGRGATAYVMMKEAHEAFQALNRDAEAALEEYKLEQDEKYEFRMFSAPLLTRQDTDALNVALKPTGLVLHPSYGEFIVALRADSDQALDMTKEWEGIDKFIAANTIDLSSQKKQIERDIAHLLQKFEESEALEEVEQRKERGAEIQLFLTRLQEAAAEGAEKARVVIHEVAGTTYLVQKRARVYKRVRLKHYTYAALSGGSAVTRLVLTGGLDPTAYYQLARSIVSATSLALRDLLNDATTTLAKVQADIKEMKDSIDQAKKDLGSVQWKDRGLASFNMAMRTLLGASVPLSGGNLAAYRQNQLLFANKLASLRQELAKRSIAMQELILTLKQEGGDLVALGEDVQARWQKVQNDISAVEKTYNVTFLQAEAALDDYYNLIGGWFKPNKDKGLVSMDAVASMQRAINVYDASAAATGAATMASLISQGADAAIALIA